MTDKRDDFINSFTNGESWLRLLFMLAFTVVLYLFIAPIVLVIMVFQAAFSLVTGNSNANLRAFSAALSKYVYQILQFLTYNNERKPFPFADFPNAEPNEAATKKKSTAKAKSAAKSTQNTSTATARKSSAKKSVKKRPAAKKGRASSSNGSGGRGSPR